MCSGGCVVWERLRRFRELIYGAESSFYQIYSYPSPYTLRVFRELITTVSTLEPIFAMHRLYLDVECFKAVKVLKDEMTNIIIEITSKEIREVIKGEWGGE